MDNPVDTIWFKAIPRDIKGKWAYSDWPVVRSSKRKLKARWIVVAKWKTEEEMQKMLSDCIDSFSLMAQARKALRAQGTFVPQPVGVEVFVGQMRWEACGDPEKPRLQKACVLCKINEVHGPAFDRCTDCLALAYIG